MKNPFRYAPSTQRPITFLLVIGLTPATDHTPVIALIILDLAVGTTPLPRVNMSRQHRCHSPDQCLHHLAHDRWMDQKALAHPML